jgi:hypothetical protein
MQRSARELGLPEKDVLWARHGERQLGIELATGSVSSEQGQQRNTIITP